MTALEPGRNAEAGELVSAAAELVATFSLSLGPASSAETVRTYRGACERFVTWLVAAVGPMAGPEDLTLANIAAYEAAMGEGGLAEATIRKDRSAINRMLAFGAEHADDGHVAPSQQRVASDRGLGLGDQPPVGDVT